MKRRVELWLWFIHEDLSDKLRVSRHRMTMDDAQAAYPGAWRVPGSMELAEIELTGDAELSLALDAWMRGRSVVTGAPESHGAIVESL